MNFKKKNNTGDVNDEVEELLRAAEDAALLKITVNSHTVHASSSDLHPDLEQRFRNLRTGSKSKVKSEASTKKMSSTKSKKKEEGEDDDLLARFAALKASIPKPPGSTLSSLEGLSTSDASVENVSGGSLLGKEIVENDDEDEVDKVIRWAMDAARLDPSPASDDDDDDENTKDYDTDDSEKSDEDDDSPSGKQKVQHK